MRIANDNAKPCQNCGRSNWKKERDTLGISRPVCLGCGNAQFDGPGLIALLLITTALAGVISWVAMP